MRHTPSTNQPATTRRPALHRGARALRLRDHLHDLRQHGVRADLLGAHHQAAAGVDRRADQLVAGPCDRESARRSAWIHPPRSALEHLAIDRHLLAGAHAQAVADVHMGQRDVFLAAVVAMRRAVFGASPSSALIAADVWERAFNSSTWPSRVSETITAAASK
jgi:hypothetical protein